MIISASYKTDIPAFYGEWFRNRRRAGFCRTVNAYNNQHSTVSLRKDDVDGFVFWTKNLGPFLPVLEEVHQDGVPFIIQYTINGYPRALESRVVDADQSVEHMRLVAARYGPRVAVWRYDTIVFSSLTDASFHRNNFRRLAGELAGATDEVVVSFMQVYKKTARNMDAAARTHGFAWHDPLATEKRVMLAGLAEIAVGSGMRLTICTQPDLVVEGVGEARCIDGDRLVEVAGRRFRTRLKGMRDGCGCFEARDIGDYDTCPHGCIYCYAVRNRDLALRRYNAHNPTDEYLFPTGPGASRTERRNQLRLFPDEDG